MLRHFGMSKQIGTIDFPQVSLASKSNRKSQIKVKMLNRFPVQASKQQMPFSTTAGDGTYWYHQSTCYAEQQQQTRTDARR
jgi:hypothetical protein